jgi:hypothetical protein
VKFLAPQEVVAAQNQGTPVIDIRPRGEWEAGHVPGSVNVEYLRLISGEGLLCWAWPVPCIDLCLTEQRVWPVLLSSVCLGLGTLHRQEWQPWALTAGVGSSQVQGGARGKCFESWRSLSSASPMAQVRSPQTCLSLTAIQCLILRSWPMLPCSHDLHLPDCGFAIPTVQAPRSMCKLCAEANPDFMDEVEAVASPDKRVILVCNMGGNLDPTYSPSKFGMQSRRAAVSCCQSRPTAHNRPASDCKSRPCRHEC